MAETIKNAANYVSGKPLLLPHYSLPFTFSPTY